MTRTYYDIFGVSRTATSDEIRTAYIALIKQYHPDVAEAETDSGAREMVALLNRCYAVLRDPRKRADYDAGLVRDSLGSETRAEQRQDLVVPAAKLQQRHWGIPLLIAAAAGIVVIAQLGWEWAGDKEYAAGSILTWGQTQPLIRPPRPLEAREVAQSARLATAVSTDEALTISRRCFDEARAQLDITSAKLCIIFDDAFLYWRQNASGFDSLPIYFGDEATRMRHLDALSEAGEHAEKQLSGLRDLTFRALLAQLRGSRDQTDASQGAPAAAAAGQARERRNTRSQNETGARKSAVVTVHI